MAKKKVIKTTAGKPQPAGTNNAGTQPVFLFILFQALAYAIVRFSGYGTAYLYMAIPLLITCFGGWLIVYKMGGETAFFLNAALLLTFGTMIQCMLMDEDVIPKSMMVIYFIAAAGGVGVGFLYKRMPFLASAQGTTFLFGLSVFLYLATLIFGKAVADGVTNWISIGSMTIQPSEFIKGMYVLILAGLLCTKRNPGRERITAAIIVTLVNLGFLGMQGEFGTFLLILATFLFMSFLFIPDLRVFGGISALLAAVGAAAFFFCRTLLSVTGGESDVKMISFAIRMIQKIQNRFIYWLDPSKDAQGAGYQILQARKALINSRLFGSDTTTTLINKTNDMVFPALTERCGLIIALIVCLLFALLVIRGTRIYFSCEDRYHQAVAAGLSIQLILQAFIIIGGSTGMLPLTGITLPLISRGGSSLMSTYMYLSIILVISAGNLWDGRRDYSAYAAQLQKKSPVHAKRAPDMRSRNRRRNPDNDSWQSGES